MRNIKLEEIFKVRRIANDYTPHIKQFFSLIRENKEYFISNGMETIPFESFIRFLRANGVIKSRLSQQKVEEIVKTIEDQFPQVIILRSKRRISLNIRNLLEEVSNEVETEAQG